MQPSDVRRVRVLNTWVENFDAASFLATLADDVASRARVVVGNHNVNSLTLYQSDPVFQEFFEIAQRCFVDGMGVVAISKLEGTRLAAENRLAVLDWIWPLFELAEREGWRITHLGGNRELIEHATATIRPRHPGLALTMLDGYFDRSASSPDNDQRLAAIRDSAPHILLVGMGMPIQEHWIVENLDALPDCVIITVGGIMGFLAGDRPTAPRWLGRAGFEWVFRVATEPRRLLRRYTVEPLALVPVIAHHTLDRWQHRAQH